MISSKKAIKILFEQDKEKREGFIDKLNEEDAKYLLKIMTSYTNIGNKENLEIFL